MRETRWKGVVLVQTKSELMLRFKKFLKKLSFKPSEAYLYGSRIKGGWLKGSDLDAIIVSEDFKGMEFTNRMAQVSTQWFTQFPRLRINLEPLCYTEKEFAKKKNEICIVSEALKYAVRV